MDFLDRNKKGITAEQNIQAIELLRSMGIMPHIYLIMADEQTTIDELEGISESLEKSLIVESTTGRVICDESGCRLEESQEEVNRYPDPVKAFYHFFETVSKIEKIYFNLEGISFLDKPKLSSARRKKIARCMDSCVQAVELVSKGDNLNDLLNAFDGDINLILNSKAAVSSGKIKTA